MIKGTHGLNLQGDAWSNEHYQWLREGGFNGLKAMHYYSVNVYKRCLEINSDIFFVVRLNYVKPIPQPQQAADAVSVEIEELLSQGIKFNLELHNEPDHVTGLEGWGAEDHQAQSFNQWFISTFQMLKQRFPQVSIGFPALAFNSAKVLNWDTAAPKPGRWNWPHYCRDAINQADWLAVHCYWQLNNMTRERFGFSFLHWHEAFPQKQIHMTEFGNSNCQTPSLPQLSDQQKAEEYKTYYHLLSQYPNFMRGAYYFMLGGTPDWEGFYLRGANEMLRDAPLLRLPTISKPFAGDRQMTQGFGGNPQLYSRWGYAGHNGIDWGLSSGTSVLAVDNGTVIKVGNDPSGYGLHIRIQHSWGESLYAHLRRIDVARGRGVGKGQPLGVSGNTGASTGPHLHFGVKVNDAKDPMYKDWVNPELLGLQAAVAVPVQPAIPEYRVEYQRYGVPRALAPAQVAQTAFALRNAGSKTWRKDGTNKVRLGYHWYDGAGREVKNVQDLRAELPHDTAAGQTVTLHEVKCAAPQTAGQYRLRWDLVEEGITWFADRGAKTLDMNVQVKEAALTLKPAIAAYLSANPQMAEFLGPQISGGFTAADGNYLEFFEDGALIVSPSQEVTLGPLGGWIRDVYQAQGRPQFQDAPPRNTPDNRFFPDTGHNLFGIFAQGYHEIFGPPVTEEFHIIVNGKGMTFQLYHFALCTHNPETNRVERVRGWLGKMFLSQIGGGLGMELIGRLL